MADIMELVSELEALPMMPATSARIVGMLNDHDVDMNEVASIVRVDDALSMVVTRYANSATFGVPGREFDLRESIIRLGSGKLLKIVLQQQVGAAFNDAGAAFGLHRGALWRGALGGAIAAENIAKKHCPDESDLCFFAGLVRDIGKLALDHIHGASYAESVSKAMTDGVTFAEAERTVFGYDHAQIGAALARHWEFPERIAAAIEHHHEPIESGEGHDVLTDIVHAADIIALWAGLAIGRDGMQYELSRHVKQSLKLSRRTAEQEIASMWEALREIENALGMQNGQSERGAA